MGVVWPYRPVPARRSRRIGPAVDPGEALRPGARDRGAPRFVRASRDERHAGARARVRLFRHRQVLSGERTAQGARTAARPVRVRQVRPVQARHPVHHSGTSLPEPCAPASGPERDRAWPLAGLPKRGAGPKWTAHREPRSRARAGDWETPPVADLPPQDAYATGAKRTLVDLKG